jgi:hypothetical protein
MLNFISHHYNPPASSFVSPTSFLNDFEKVPAIPLGVSIMCCIIDSHMITFSFGAKDNLRIEQ